MLCSVDIRLHSSVKSAQHLQKHLRAAHSPLLSLSVDTYWSQTAS